MVQDANGNSSGKDIIHARTILTGFVLDDGLHILSHLQAKGFTMCCLHYQISHSV